MRRISSAYPSPALASAAGITHTSLHMPHVSPTCHSCRGRLGPLNTLQVPVAPLVVGTLLWSSPCTLGSGCCAHVHGCWPCSELALPWLDPTPDAPPGTPVCSHTADSPGTGLCTACQVMCPHVTSECGQPVHMLLCALLRGVLSLGCVSLCLCGLCHMPPGRCSPKVTIARRDPHPVVL